MSDRNPTDIQIISAALGMDEAILQAVDSDTFAGLLKVARKKTERDANKAILTPILDAIKAANVTIPAGFRVVIDHNEKDGFSVNLRKKSAGSSGSGNRGKSIKVTKGPKAILGKTFPSGRACADALLAYDSEKFPQPNGEFSAPALLRKFGIEFDFIPKQKDSEK